MKPIRKSGVLVQDLGEETLLYSAEEKVIHILNPTAQRIWELCNGEHTVDDMAQAMRASFSEGNEHDVAGDVQQTLKVFASKGLLQGHGNQAEPPGT